MGFLGGGKKAFIDALVEGRLLDEAKTGDHLFGRLDEVGGVYVLELAGSLLYLGDQLLIEVLSALFPFVADLGSTPVELLQELPKVDV